MDGYCNNCVTSCFTNSQDKCAESVTWFVEAHILEIFGTISFKEFQLTSSLENSWNCKEESKTHGNIIDNTISLQNTHVAPSSQVHASCTLFSSIIIKINCALFIRENRNIKLMENVSFVVGMLIIHIEIPVTLQINFVWILITLIELIWNDLYF